MVDRKFVKLENGFESRKTDTALDSKQTFLGFVFVLEESGGLRHCLRRRLCGIHLFPVRFFETPNIFCLMIDINPNTESAKSQKKRIIEILRLGGRPSIYELILSRCWVDARKRISELRDEGYDIRSEYFRTTNDEGHIVRYKRYWLAEEPKA